VYPDKRIRGRVLIAGKCADRYRADAPRPSVSGNTPLFSGFISALQIARPISEKLEGAATLKAW
jgi:hypothetical protein